MVIVYLYVSESFCTRIGVPALIAELFSGIAYVTDPTGRFVALSDLSTITVLTPKNGGRTSPSTQISVHITTKCTINFNTFDIGNLPLSY